MAKEKRRANIGRRIEAIGCIGIFAGIAIGIGSINAGAAVISAGFVTFIVGRFL